MGLTFIGLLIFAFVFSFFCTLYLVPLFIKIAYKFSILDAPDGGLKNHKKPTPYLGGVAVYVSFIAAFSLVVAPYVSNTVPFLLGITLLLFVGLADDLLVLEPHYKLYGQVIAALCFLKGGYYLKEAFFLSCDTRLESWGLIVISFIWIIAIINAINLIDVMDGLASSIAGVASFSLFVSALLLGASIVALLLAALLGSLLGFFVYNRPPARIYLGDAGSLCIGGLLATVPFMLSWGAYNRWGYLSAPIFLGIPLLEVLTLIAVRWYKGIPFYRGSPDHFCHYLMRKGWSTGTILMYSAAWGLILGVLGILFLIGYLSFLKLIYCGITLFLLWYYFLWYY